MVMTDDRLTLFKNALYFLSKRIPILFLGSRAEFRKSVLKKFRPGIRSPLFILYVNYALDNRTRGEGHAERFFRDKSVISSFLDVGCAYGGTVLAMESKNVKRTVGFDLDEKWIELANKQKLEMKKASKSIFEVGNIEDTKYCNTLGKFEIISCIDVLEHVLDLEKTIKNLAGLLENNGLLYCDITNGLSFQNISSDSHHNLFGAVLLERSLAEKQFHSHFGTSSDYEVGFFPTLEWFRVVFNKHGLTFEVLNESETDYSINRVQEMADLLHAKYLEHLNTYYEDQEISKQIQVKYESFVSTYNYDRNQLSLSDLYMKYIPQVYKVKSTPA
jgi:SAM-dependent methyltransferase